MTQVLRYSAVLCAAATQIACMPASWGAAALLHPSRRAVTRHPSRSHENFTFIGAGGVTLRGWRFRADGAPRGTIVYLHGVADNRQSSIGIVERYTAKGYDVIAYDSRAHGESAGEACTYGYHERHDLRRALALAPKDPVVVIGHSLGAAVALQTAPLEPRIRAIVAIAPFSSLREIARERAPFFATAGDIDKAFRVAETRASFRADDVSPLAAARRIRVPVLLVHGARDTDTSPEHSRRIYEALGGRRELILVPEGAHNGATTAETWADIDRWIDAGVALPASGRNSTDRTPP